MKEDSLKNTDPSRLQKLPLATVLECSESPIVRPSFVAGDEARDPCVQADFRRETQL
jgi:hypothetical protein